MGVILNIDTSSELCSVVISRCNEFLSIKELQKEQFVHAEQLHLLINECLLESNIDISTINAIAVSSGPGSYTGLRIGVSAAKGLAYGLNVPLISVSTLESLCNGASEKGFKGLFCPMIDARRMEVYCALYDEYKQILKPIEAKVVEGTIYEEFSNQEIVCFGSGAEKCMQYLDKNFTYIPNVIPSAKYMVPLSYAKFVNLQHENIALFEPLYLKDFIAGKPKNIFAE